MSKTVEIAEKFRESKCLQRAIVFDWVGKSNAIELSHNLLWFEYVWLLNSIESSRSNSRVVTWNDVIVLTVPRFPTPKTGKKPGKR